MRELHWRRIERHAFLDVKVDEDEPKPTSCTLDARLALDALPVEPNKAINAKERKMCRGGPCLNHIA